VGQTRDIARFRAAELIGRGGFGSVYRAADAEHGRDVAVKVLHDSLGETERRRFDRERQTMGRLGAHPNIIPVYESGYTDEGEAYLVMELAAGGSLRQQLEADQRMGWPEAVSIAAAIAGAAQAAHDQGVLHRDIKPDNILIDAYGNPRLSDFGIAAVASNATATTSTTATLAHAAPELLEGKPATPAVDTYAIGSTLYNLITGHPPFYRPDDVGVGAMMARILSNPPPDLRSYSVPDAVALVAERALAKDPGHRQLSAAQLAAELTAAATAAGSAHDVGPIAGAGAAAAGSADGTMFAPVQPAGATPPVSPGSPSSLIEQAGSYVGAAGQFATQPGASFTPPHAPSTTRIPPEALAAAPGQVGGGGVGPTQDVSPSRSGRTALIVATAVVLVALAGAVGAIIASQAGGDSPGGLADRGGATDLAAGSSTTTTPGSTSTDSAPVSPTDPQSTTTDAPVTTAVATSASTAVETTASTTTSPPPPDPCRDRVFAAQTARFNIRICGDGAGNLLYRGDNRTNSDSIEIPACFAGDGQFVAQNLGFTYVIDTFALRLTVTDPRGAELVNDTLSTPSANDLSFNMTFCS